jgi:hypothetical protein
MKKQKKMEKIFLIFFVKKNSKFFEKKPPSHGKKPPIMVTYLTIKTKLSLIDDIIVLIEQFKCWELDTKL